jgi:ribosomal protein S18 acetylase RimI-like enzyme
MIRRSEARDREAILAVVARTGFFRAEEIDVAREVLDEALAEGPSGHYQSYVAEVAGRVAGWSCFGPTPGTRGAFDLYWIAVDPDLGRRGIGSALVADAERRVRERGGRLLVAETSGRDLYAPTRSFYERLGYREEARIADFYVVGDDKVILIKRLA